MNALVDFFKSTTGAFTAATFIAGLMYALWARIKPWWQERLTASNSEFSRERLILQMLLYLLDIGYFRSDVNGRWIETSRRLRHQLMSSPERLKGWGWLDVLTIENKDVIRDIYKDAINLESGVDVIVDWTRRSTQSNLRVRMILWPEVDVTGKCIGFIGFLREHKESGFGRKVGVGVSAYTGSSGTEAVVIPSIDIPYDNTPSDNTPSDSSPSTPDSDGKY
jgi:hypothetical protein